MGKDYCGLLKVTVPGLVYKKESNEADLNSLCCDDTRHEQGTD